MPKKIHLQLPHLETTVFYFCEYMLQWCAYQYWVILLLLLIDYIFSKAYNVKRNVLIFMKTTPSI